MFMEKKAFVKILGVKVSCLDFNDTLELIEKWLSINGGLKFVVTPNPEFLVKAVKDNEFKEILNSADIAIPDGSKLIWASKNAIKEKVTGVDLMESLCEVCERKSLTVGLIGGHEKIALRTAECLNKSMPKLKIKTWEEPSQDVRHVDVLFVALGMGKQEKWIFNNKNMLEKNGVRLAMGVGGAFDYISGAVPRAPKFMRNHGLEWLFRLIRQPWRIKRQLALVEFVRLVTRGERRARRERGLRGEVDD
jgi:N-acetylglucosaminyldiphosphoundecaprenol N-acetyl-beta-D-mannosaminyltransferase